MSKAPLFPGPQENSPRSTILVATPASMTSALPVMNNRGNVPSDETITSPGKIPPSQSIDSKSNSEDTGIAAEDKVLNGSEVTASKSFDNETPPTPISQEYPTYLPYLNPSQTPQPASGYYVYPAQTHMIPDPDSPGGSRLVGTYDAGSFFQPHSGAAFQPPSASPSTFLRVGRATKMPSSPSRGSSASATMGTPTSPLFTRTGSGGTRIDGLNAIHPTAPPLPYMVSPLHHNPSLYQMYPSAGITSNSSDEGAWPGQAVESRNQGTFQHETVRGMQMHYSVPMTRTSTGSRSYSIDETMLPQSVLEDQGNPAFSPYPGTQITHPSTNGYSPQMSWGYSPNAYAASPLQPRPTLQIGMPPNSPGLRQGSTYGQNYTINNPGHPIQTTALNKGPDGANLFIFHIPNHFTNLDMFHLFMPYGNLLSVRIMVERDSGRSRGFGFVSYDTAESAALAIKELNGYPIGNKRLKVQHKQIRRNDLQDEDDLHDSFISTANFAQDPSLPAHGPADDDWYASDKTEPEEGILSVDARVSGVGNVSVDPEKQEMPRPNNNVEYPHDIEQSPLTNLGQLETALPTIAGQRDTFE